MKWSNFIPRANIPVVRQGSPLASPRESNSLGHLWEFVRDGNARADKITNSIGQMQRAMGQMNQRSYSGYFWHPFKIYSPSQLWSNSKSGFFMLPATSDLWRTFRIRNGMVLTTTADGYEVDGTDKVEQPYDETFMYRNDGTMITDVQEYVVPYDNSRFNFWIEIYADASGDDQAIIRYGSDPTVTTYTDPDNKNPSWTAQNPWTTYPTPDSNHFIIGFVDTSSRKSEGLALVRQFQITDILASGSGGSPCPMG